VNVLSLLDMPLNARFCLLLSSIFLGGILHSQVNSLQISPEKEKMYAPYMYHIFGGPEGVVEFKKEQPHEYLKLMWYYSESFYVKRDYYPEGAVLEPAAIDISRFESNRKENELSFVTIPGYRDVIVLLPVNELIYKPK
jgi:hypothetical protein